MKRDARERRLEGRGSQVMRASLTIGGLEVAVTTPAGSLENAVAERYAPFLGAVNTPVCSLALEPCRADVDQVAPPASLVERVGKTTFRLIRPGLFGLLDLAGAGAVDVAADPCALDGVLRVLFGLLTYRHGGVMLRATTISRNGETHVFIGRPAAMLPDARRIGYDEMLTDGAVLLVPERGGWTVAAAPFWPGNSLVSTREPKLTRLWWLSPAERRLPETADLEADCLAIAEHMYLPTADGAVRRSALDVIRSLVHDVPISQLNFSKEPHAWFGRAAACAPHPGPAPFNEQNAKDSSQERL